MPAVAHAPRFGAHSAAVYNDEIEIWHFDDVQAACNLPHRNKRLYDGDSDGKSETYPVELFVKHPSPNIAIVEYTRETLFQRKAAAWKSPSNDTPLKPVGHPAYSASNKPRPAARRLLQIGRLSV